MITYKMHLLRTGTTFDGGQRRFAGQDDPPLSIAGLEQLEALQTRCDYPKVEMVFTSPLRRCLQTADILYPELLTETVDSLMDMHLGSFQGRTFDELRDDRDFALWLENSQQHTPPGGELPSDFQLRIVSAVRDIFQRMMDERMSSVAVVTHGDVIMTLLAGIGLPKRPLQEWATPGGTGYTLLFTPQMWMRDGCAEVYLLQPEPRPDDNSDLCD